MAFVFETERKINETNKLANPLGPGHYFNLSSDHNLHSSAPFHSSSTRKTIFDNKEKQKPGPGDYDISKPIIEPNIKSVSNSHSIILKINSTGTAQFKSTNARFREHNSTSPGPGQYLIDGAKSKERRKINSSLFLDNHAANRLKELNKTYQMKNIPTIPDKIRGLTDSKKEEEVPQIERLGPACYNPNKTVHVNSTGTVWGKDKTKRFVMDRKIALGPGQYKADYQPSRPEDKANLSSGNFRSTTVKSYFDSLIYKSNVEATVNQRAKGKFKAKEPAPGQYDYNVSSFETKQKPFSFQFFGSTVERFEEIQQLNQKPKKNAFYNIRSQIGQNRSFNRGNNVFYSEVKRQPEFLQLKQHQKNPGPGQYKEKVVVQKKLKGAKVQKFGFTTDRPFYKPDKVDQVGPGKYQKNENVEQFIKTRFGQIKNQSFHFKSATARNCFGQIKDDAKFGEYDVSYNDVAKKLERQKMFLENLKKIDVQKPGFESNISRFPHYENKISPTKEKQNKMNSNREQELKIKEEAERARSMIIDSNRSQIQQKRQKGFFNKQERFDSFRRGVPGVGSYTKNAAWEKPTFNVKFQKK